MKKPRSSQLSHPPVSCASRWRTHPDGHAVLSSQASMGLSGRSISIWHWPVTYPAPSSGIRAPSHSIENPPVEGSAYCGTSGNHRSLCARHSRCIATPSQPPLRHVTRRDSSGASAGHVELRTPKVMYPDATRSRPSTSRAARRRRVREARGMPTAKEAWQE